jgi:UTP--glucose-1-phosphate uridylyltransferase
MLPANQAIPKELLPIYVRPLIEHFVKEAIENYFDAHYELEHRLVKKGMDKIFYIK